MGLELYAPTSYTDASNDEREKVVNGCGAAGSKFDFVPDTILGLNVSCCCHIHDWMYDKGATLEDKKEADRVFLNNVLRVIEDKGGWFKRWRRRIAYGYYIAVKKFGGPAYWANKNG